MPTPKTKYPATRRDNYCWVVPAGFYYVQYLLHFWPILWTLLHSCCTDYTFWIKIQQPQMQQRQCQRANCFYCLSPFILNGCRFLLCWLYVLKLHLSSFYPIQIIYLNPLQQPLIIYGRPIGRPVLCLINAAKPQVESIN